MFLRTADADIFVNDFGQVGSNTFVAHGGWVGSGELWLQPFEQLSRRWRCIAYDHRGTGATRQPGGAITPEILVDDLFRVLDALSIERCILASESMGGVTVLQAALRAPERFSGLVLIAARYQGQLSEGGRKLIAGCKADFPATMKSFVNACTPEEDCAAERNWALRIVMRSNAQDAAQLLECMGDVDLGHRLCEIRLPTLLIHGRHDVIRPMSDSEFLHANIAGSRLVPFENAGHVPTVTRPARSRGKLKRSSPDRGARRSTAIAVGDGSCVRASQSGRRPPAASAVCCPVCGVLSSTLADAQLLLTADIHDQVPPVSAQPKSGSARSESG